MLGKKPSHISGEPSSVVNGQGRNGGTIDETAAIRSIPLPQRAQGAAFDKGGNLWLTASGSWFGALYRLDSKGGEVRQRFPMVIGIEDAAFDDAGGLWAVAEAGSLRWRMWSETFPVLFRVDLDKLQRDR